MGCAMRGCALVPIAVAVVCLARYPLPAAGTVLADTPRLRVSLARGPLEQVCSFGAPGAAPCVPTRCCCSARRRRAAGDDLRMTNSAGSWKEIASAGTARRLWRSPSTPPR